MCKRERKGVWVSEFLSHVRDRGRGRERREGGKRGRKEQRKGGYSLISHHQIQTDVYLALQHARHFPPLSLLTTLKGHTNVRPSLNLLRGFPDESARGTGRQTRIPALPTNSTLTSVPSLKSPTHTVGGHCRISPSWRQV